MIQDATAFLSKVYPFSDLPKERLGEVGALFSTRHLPAGEVLALDEGAGVQPFFVVQDGILELRLETNLVGVFMAGDLFGFEANFLPPQEKLAVVAVQDAILLSMPGEAFCELLPEGDLDSFFRRRSEHLQARLKEFRQLQRNSRIDPFLRLAIRDLTLKQPVFVPSDASATEAAKAMVQRESTSCLVRGEDGLYGILTEKDILGRVVAADIDPKTTPAVRVMSTPLITIRPDCLLFEAFSLMVRSRIRTLVVEDSEGRPAGLLEERDMLSVKGENPVHLAAEISRAENLGGLSAWFSRIADMAMRSVAEGIGIFNVGRLVSELHDQVILRVVQLVLAEMGGPPPTPFGLVALGSEGRKEQYLATDQDNALITMERGMSADQDYFTTFAARLVDSLLVIGFPPCPHKVMINNPDWRMSLPKWMDTVDEMLRKADVESVLKTSMLVDMRHVAGDAELSGKFKAYLFKRVGGSPFLLKYMAREALRFTPPLGFFNNLVVEKSGSRKGELDIKKGGVFPLTQGIRTLAVEHGVLETSTEERISRLVEQGVFSQGLGSGIKEAYAFFQELRIRAQTDRLREGARPDNHILPDRLSAFERDRLKEGFRVVIDFQSLLYNKYGLHLLT